MNLPNRSAFSRSLVPSSFCFVAVLIAGCDVDPYCLTCQTLDASVPVEAGAEGGARPDRFIPDGCISTEEICDNKDNDCDGLVDEGPPAMGVDCRSRETLVAIGAACGSDEGECQVGRSVCQAGCVVCGEGAVEASAERCDNKDNDCDGMIDNGNPEGGAACGKDDGECEYGSIQCMAGVKSCVGGRGESPEQCDGKDNDCDGIIDDGNPGTGDPTKVPGAICMAGADECTSGRWRCQGGSQMCIMALGPQPEICDRIDNDCDSSIDEDFNLQSDPANCGMCGNRCNAANARVTCTTGMCRIATCATNFWDIDGNYANGCEYECRFRGAEICDGIDNDCDSLIDTMDPQLPPPPAICATAGACAGAAAVCDGSRWVCRYSASVATNAAGEIIPESNCDNVDNDCDGATDETFPMRNRACSLGQGVCRTEGMNVCNDARDNLRCTAPTPPAGTAEVCDGRDNDCDGMLDEDAPDDWVRVFDGFDFIQMYKYEASRPDSTATSQGDLTHRSCSARNRLPWTNVTYEQAQSACRAIGAAVCTDRAFRFACYTNLPTMCLWSHGPTCDRYTAGICNDNRYDADSLAPGDQDAMLPTGSFPMCYSAIDAANQVFDLSGNVKEWAEQTVLPGGGINRILGGAYNNPPDGTRCDADFERADQDFLFSDVGFRCCKPL